MNPRKQIRVDLEKFITKELRLNHIIVLFIDVNDHKPNSTFYKLEKIYCPINIVAQDRAIPPMATHYCGNHINYMLISPDLAAGTVASGILSINHNIISSHRASYCDIDVKTLF